MQPSHDAEVLRLCTHILDTASDVQLNDDNLSAQHGCRHRKRYEMVTNDNNSSHLGILRLDNSSLRVILAGILYNGDNELSVQGALDLAHSFIDAEITKSREMRRQKGFGRRGEGKEDI